MHRRRKNHVIYFDETYDGNKKYFVFGALFCPSRDLHRSISGVLKATPFRDKNGRQIEAKYNNCFTEENYKIATKLIDFFIVCDCWMRVIVVNLDPAAFDLNWFGAPHEDNKMKMARFYKHFTEKLLWSTTKYMTDGVLLMDQLTRCNGDTFMALMKDQFGEAGRGHSLNKTRPTLKHIGEIESDRPEHASISVCDLVIGSVLNSHVPAKNEFKNKLPVYIANKFSLGNLLYPSWGKMDRTQPAYRKLSIWWPPLRKKA